MVKDRYVLLNKRFVKVVEILMVLCYSILQSTLNFTSTVIWCHCQCPVLVIHYYVNSYNKFLFGNKTKKYVRTEYNIIYDRYFLWGATFWIVET